MKIIGLRICEDFVFNLDKRWIKVGLNPRTACLQCRNSTIWLATQLTPVLGYCYLFKLLPNLILTVTLMLDSIALHRSIEMEINLILNKRFVILMEIDHT